MEFSDKLYIAFISLLCIRRIETMPTNKKPFTFNIKDEYLQKIKYISNRETRSTSNLLEHLCKLYIEKYEQEHGEIKIENTSKTD